MAEHGIPGGVFVLVADGAIVHAQGYGHTDLDRDTPVDAQRTRFDIGSVSKLLTATAVMQQVEQGTLDLDTDVNDYLTDLVIPDTFPEPVTPAHLLTHTAGFGEYYLLGSAAPGPGSPIRWLRAWRGSCRRGSVPPGSRTSTTTSAWRWRATWWRTSPGTPSRTT
jgi:CubicO group peptidase (beta-lactamase class C family)